MQRGASILALDVGGRRVGMAMADAEVRFAHPFDTVEYTAEIFEQIEKIVQDHNVKTIVVGLPRGLDGQRTMQTDSIEKFALELKQSLDVPVVLQDEALTSVKAESELQAKLKHGVYNKSDVDSLAATYILEDYIAENKWKK
jgi:putative Holliday junction resolvase